MKGMQPPWVVLAVFLCMAPFIHGEDIFCFNSGSCYMILMQKLPFNNATSSCGFKGSLATMKNEQEQRDILQLLRQFQSKESPQIFWIGLFRKAKDCVLQHKKLNGFTWVSGGDNTTVSYWAEKPSMTCTRKRCVGLQSDGGPITSGPGNHSWGWKEYKCGSSFASVCHSNAPWSFSTQNLTEVETIPHPFTDQYMPGVFKEGSRIVIQCKGSGSKIALSCGMVNGSYSCKNAQCSCMNGEGGGSHTRCRNNERVSCFQQCLYPGNVTCNCTAEDSVCGGDGKQCPLNVSSSPTPITTNSTQPNEQLDGYNRGEVDYVDTLVVPLILGIVVLGILVMFIWGGVQMCLRKKRKPKRKKSIVPTEPDGSETDSTDHSSEDEEEEEEPQERTEIP